MIDSDIHAQTYQFFLEEAPELLQTLETGLLNLNSDRSSAVIHEIMRSAHSIKGGAATVGLDALANIAHRLESILRGLHSDKVNWDSELETWLLEAYDCLREPLEQQIDQGGFDSELALENSEGVFAKIEERLGDVLKESDNYLPSSSDLGVDMVSSIFEIDVAQGIDRLSKVLAKPQEHEVAGELRAQAEVFAGFAEILTLPGFEAIAKTSIEALDANPHRVLEILSVALTNFQAARELVLAGDRDRGGEPSEALTALSLPSNVNQSAAATVPLQQELPELTMVSTEAPTLLTVDSFNESLDSLESFLSATDGDAEFEIPTEEITDSELGAFTEALETPEIKAFTEAVETPKLELEAFTETIETVEPKAVAKPVETPKLELEAFTETIETVEPKAVAKPVETPKLELEAFTEAVETPKLELEAFTETIETVEPKAVAKPVETPKLELEAFTEAVETAEPKAVAKPVETKTDLKSYPIISQQLLSKNSYSKQSSIQKSSSQKTLIQSKSKSKSAAKLKVRVDLERLEKMNNLVGELVIDRNTLALQQEHLQTIVSKIQQGLQQFQNLTRTLEELSDQSVISPIQSMISSAIDQSGLASIESELDLQAFQDESSDDDSQATDSLFGEIAYDSLEMDTYGERHSSIQQVLEEMMQLEEAVEDLSLFTRQSDKTIKQQQQTLTQLRDELMWARMLPLETVLNKFPRALRTLSTKYKKPVKLEMKGADILIDKGILEKLNDPLLHLVRNAFDHGIETPDMREQQGKSSTGIIAIHAAHDGNRTLIEISDDGRGLDLMKIAQKAIDRGWLSIEQLAETSKEQLLDFIFEPGFSTAAKVSELSGRGVGLDIVRSQLKSVKGSVTVDSSPGKGTIFTLSLPLTLTIAKLLVCSVGTTLLALPVASIQEIIMSDTIQTQQIGEQRVMPWEEQLLPIHRLSDLLEYRYPALTNQNKTLANGSAMLVIRSEESNFAIEVEDFGTEQEMVIKPLTGRIPTPNYVYGCTVMGDGSLIPAIDAAALLAFTKKANKTSKDAAQVIAGYQDFSANATNDVPVPAVLVVDDSAMMRKTVALTLQKVGYRVLQARDGQEAIELLWQNSSIDLIVSDLEMPRLNGFEFLNQLRQDTALSEIPVVMLTTRSNDKHRQLALQLGASAYMSKPYIEQEFLDVLRNTVNRESNVSSSVSYVA